MNNRSAGPMEQAAVFHVGQILRNRAAASFGSPALISPGSGSVSSGALYGRVAALVSALRRHGVARTDVVAVVLPEGPDLASAILAVASAAMCAPLNPDLPPAEFQFFLGDMKAKAILISATASTAALETARQMRLKIILMESLEWHTDGAQGLPGGSQDQECASDFTRADDVAFLLYTSGTTAKPKCVALRHRSLCISAAGMSNTLALRHDDACLGVMPLFHVHGLVGTLLAPLLSGGAAIFPGRFDAARFFEQMAATTPSWITGTPAFLHQIAERACDHRETVRRSRLRFIRSASAPLPVELMFSLEGQFRVPVIQAYGMTEACHEIASNPLPPRPRKPGSVGLPGIAQVAVHGPDGRALGHGELGEIVIRGPTVISHYHLEPSSDEAAFREGWLRTGDRGFLDDDGYLFIEGRLKEIINRGGEKISPAEVEAILNRHPGVAESGVFSIPDARLGEDIAACVVLKSGAEVGSRELQDFAAKQLADHKIPRHVLFVNTLPKSATGKLQRSALQTEWSERGAKNDSTTQTSACVGYPSPTEELLASIWADVLVIDDIGRDQSFFDLGGDSLQALRIIARIRAHTGIELPISAMFDRPTIAGLAREIEGLAPTKDSSATSIAPADFSSNSRPLSFTQKLIVGVAQDPLLVGTTVFNRIAALRIAGQLDKDALQVALNGIVLRHEVLRSNVLLSGNNASAILHPERQAALIDLGAIDMAKQAERLQAAALEFGNRVYDLTRDSLIRFGLLRLSDTEHALLVCSHNVVFDGWSMRLFIQELAAHYRAAVQKTIPELDPLPIQYSDYAQWQADRLEAGALDKSMSYWQQFLAAPPPPVEFDRAKWESKENRFELHQRIVSLDAKVTRALRDIAARNSATLNMVLLAALGILLARLRGRRDVVVLTQSAGRSQKETEALLGNFVNVVPIRCNVERGRTFLQQLTVFRRIILDATANESVPFTTLIEKIFPNRNLLVDPLSPLLFVFKNFSMPTCVVDGTIFSPLEIEHIAEPFGLIVEVKEDKPALHCSVLYNPIVVSEEEAGHLAICYRLVLEQVAADQETPVQKFLKVGLLVKALGLRVVLVELLKSLRARWRRYSPV